MSLLRNHPSPLQSKLYDLQLFLDQVVDGEVSSITSDNLAQSLLQVNNQINDNNNSNSNNKDINILIQNMAIRSMTEAKYICTGSSSLSSSSLLSHYGLHLDFYTHFTSPIRRYADVIVHRLLLASLDDDNNKHQNNHNISNQQQTGVNVPKSSAMSVLHYSPSDNNNDSNDDDGDFLLDSLIGNSAEELSNKLTLQDTAATTTTTNDQLYTSEEVSNICNILNTQYRITKQCSLHCHNLYLNYYFYNHTKICTAIILSLRVNGMYVYVPDYNIQGVLYLLDKSNYVHLDPNILNDNNDDDDQYETSLPSKGFLSIHKKFLNGSTILSNDKKSLNLKINGVQKSKNIDFHLLDAITILISSSNNIDDDTTNISNIARIASPKFYFLKCGKYNSTTTTSSHLMQVEDLQNMKNTTTNMTTAIQESLSTTIIDNNHTSTEKQEEEKSIYQIINSIPITPNISTNTSNYNTPNNNSCNKNKIGTIKDNNIKSSMPGRMNVNHFYNPNSNKTLTTSIESTNVIANNQPPPSTMEQSKVIERQATSRMQRLAAEKRNARRSRAITKKK